MEGEGARIQVRHRPLFLKEASHNSDDDNPFGLAKPEYETGDAQVVDIRLHA